MNTNISEIVKDNPELLLSSAMKSYIGFRLAYWQLTLTNSKGQGYCTFLR